MALFDRISNLFRRQRHVTPRIIANQDGLQILLGDEVTASVLWRDVRKIITYKYDRVTTDDICVGFLKEKTANSWIEINEDWAGFTEATKIMSNIFSSIPKDWFGVVMAPAFERKETVLWESNN